MLGHALAHYRILERIGSGGMGDVYLAEDTKLNRKIALKVLPPDVAADQERRSRFEREAKAIAALTHPSIVTVHSVEESDGVHFITMELVEGKTLTTLLRKGGLPLGQFFDIAIPLTDAVAAAHREAITHRDLKPDNVMVTNDGRVKVLDFGLAKLAAGFAPNSEGATAAKTEEGVIVGTVAYMSPEQAEGKPVDHRSDIFSLGILFYEMLVGARPFVSETPAGVLSKVIQIDPMPVRALRPDVPKELARVVKRCLAKELTLRFQSALDVRNDVAELKAEHETGELSERALASSTGSQGIVTAARAALGVSPWKRIAIGLGACTVLLALVSAWSISALRRPGSRAVARFDVTPAEGQPLVTSSFGVDIALSPDGEMIVYVGMAPSGGTQLWRRRLEDLEAVALPGTAGAAAPVVSPDGLSVAFTADEAIRTLALQGGLPVTIVAEGGAPAWGADGMIYFGRGGVSYRVSATGGDPVAITEPIDNVIQIHPGALPGGRGLLFTLFRGTPAQSRIAVVGAGGGQAREILTGTMARYAATGHIVYATAGGTLMAAPFDVQRLEVTGPSVALVEGVAVDNSATSQFALSESGTLLYGTGTGFVSELVWVSRAGAVEPVDPAWTAEFGSPVLSPDGRQLAVAIQGTASMDIWVKQLDRGPSIRLTVDGNRSDYPTWTPDGSSVTFSSDRAGPSFDLWTKRADGSGDSVLELDEQWALAEALWSPDGDWFIHRTSTNVKGAGDILAHRKSQQARAVPLVASVFTEVAPAISPNGHWMAYSSDETGMFEIFVVPFPNAGDAKWPVSVGGGTEPAWSRDGRELFYRNRQLDMVAMRVETEPTFATGPASVLFSTAAYQANPVHRRYDVAADGRFILIRPVGAGHESQLILVQNFLEELRARVPR